VKKKEWKMRRRDIKKKIKFLSTLPKARVSDLSFIDTYTDSKIHDICEACYNIVQKKIPIDSRKRNQLKNRLIPIHKEVRRLANPKLKVKTKRKILKTPQVGSGIFYSHSFNCNTSLTFIVKKK